MLLQEEGIRNKWALCVSTVKHCLLGAIHSANAVVLESRLRRGIHHPGFERLRKISAGTSQLAFRGDGFSVSVLVPVYHPDRGFFREALVSILDQGVEDFEVLVGFDGDHSEGDLAIVSELREKHQNGGKLRSFEVGNRHGGGISRTTNFLASRAVKEFVLLVDHDDWIRPDLLLRYRQTLSVPGRSAGRTVLYCNEFRIDERGSIIPGSSLHKPIRPVFPYLFHNWICHALLIPRAAWSEVEGLRSERDGAQDYDICLRLDLAGYEFMGVPVPLYAWRAHEKSTAANIEAKPEAANAGLASLRDYVERRGLDWDCEHGDVPTMYRPIPRRTDRPRVQAILPFRDQADLTLAAVESLLAQEGVHLRISCVDNRSDDRSLGGRLRDLGETVEVFDCDEPFNFSRLCNVAATRGTDEPYLLFVNNDVELEPGALFEMLRWIDQPKIGAVGARLFFPDGRIQHAGISIHPEATWQEILGWGNLCCGRQAEESGFTANPMIVDAVTGACLLVRRDIFEEVGGFDEKRFPIACSDTDLCLRIRRRKGLHSFFTPAAQGIHHESYTRGRGNLEDFEFSRFLPRELYGGDPGESLVPYYSSGI